MLKEPLPAAPADFGTPVPVPQATAQTFAIVYAARLKAALLEANARLDNDRAFWTSLESDRK